MPDVCAMFWLQSGQCSSFSKVENGKAAMWTWRLPWEGAASTGRSLVPRCSLLQKADLHEPLPLPPSSLSRAPWWQSLFRLLAQEKRGLQSPAQSHRAIARSTRHPRCPLADSTTQDPQGSKAQTALRQWEACRVLFCAKSCCVIFIFHGSDQDKAPEGGCEDRCR